MKKTSIDDLKIGAKGSTARVDIDGRMRIDLKAEMAYGGTAQTILREYRATNGDLSSRIVIPLKERGPTVSTEKIVMICTTMTKRDEV